MSNDNKTLADVQPGGRVRLGDQAERARFEAWALRECLTLHRYADGSGKYSYDRTDSAWKVWQYLSAQPSPGGQDAPEIEQIRTLVSSILSTVSLGHQKGPYAYAGEDFGRYLAEATRDCRAILRALSDLAARQPVGDQHPDDLAVDAFAAAMKAKMAEARAKGRGGWEDPAQCTAEDLSRMLRDHVEKGDPRDVANFCMMLHQRGEAIVARQPVGEPVMFINSAHLADVQIMPMVESMDEPNKMVPRNMAGINVRDEYHDMPLYAAPPVQAVGLGQFREAVAEWRSNWANYGRTMTSAGRDTSKARRNVDEADRLLALIDSKAVGNGN